MTRRRVGIAVVAALGLLIAGDWAAGREPNPFQAPPLLAWGSGGTAPTAHCAALPTE